MALKVIGAGLGRTGTASVKMALEQLGFGPCYHMGEVFANLDYVPLWEQVGAGKPDWARIFADYQSSTDYPVCNFWPELMEFYPDARVILTVRDPESWFESVNSTIMSPRAVQWINGGPLAEFFRTCVFRDFPEGLIHDRAFMTDYFRRHTERVKEGVPADRLLVFEARQGWEPLCSFLDAPVPDEPFPRMNNRDETAALLDAMMEGDQGDGMQTNLKEQTTRLFVHKDDST